MLNITNRTVVMFGSYQFSSVNANVNRTTFRQRRAGARLKSAGLYANASESEDAATQRMERMLRWQRREANNGQANLIIASCVSQTRPV